MRPATFCTFIVYLQTKKKEGHIPVPSLISALSVRRDDYILINTPPVTKRPETERYILWIEEKQLTDNLFCKFMTAAGCMSTVIYRRSVKSRGGYRYYSPFLLDSKGITGGFYEGS